MWIEYDIKARPRTKHNDVSYGKVQKIAPSSKIVKYHITKSELMSTQKKIKANN